MVLPLASLLGAFAKVPSALAEGFAFGTGYGSGVRFGYNNVYSWFKGIGKQALGALGLRDPRGFADSGVDVAGTRFSSPSDTQPSPIGNFFSP